MKEHKPYGFYERFVKRPQDFLCALLAIIVLSPVLLIVAFLVRIQLGRPVLFIHQKPVKDKRIFQFYKFRSMTEQRDSYGNQFTNEERLSVFDQILRTTDLGEIRVLLERNGGGKEYWSEITERVIMFNQKINLKDWTLRSRLFSSSTV